TEAPEAARSLVARRARRRHARPARHPYQRRLGRLLEQARPKQLARKSKPPLPITKIRSMIASLWIAPSGCCFVVDADLKSYFDTIPHDRLIERLEARISDGRVLDLIQAWLNQEIVAECGRWTPAGGTPQGAVISP